MARGGRSGGAHRVVVGVQVRDEEGGDVGQNGVHGVAVVTAQLTEGSLAAVQQQRLTRAAATQQTGSDALEHHISTCEPACGPVNNQQGNSTLSAHSFEINIGIYWYRENKKGKHLSFPNKILLN